MDSSTIRKAIGVVKDQTSISIAKVSGNIAPDLEVLIVKATGHDNEPADEKKYTREILNLTSHSKSYTNACISALSKRLSKTHDWIVALKALMLIHRLLVDGEPAFGQEMIHVSRKRTRVLNMSDFHDEAHSNSWEHSGFVKTYAMYLDRKLEFMAFEQNISSFNNSSHLEDAYKDFNGDLDESGRKDVMKTEKVLERLHYLLRVLDRVLSCRPTGDAKNTKMVLIALHLVLKESFMVYADACEMVEVLLERFSQMEYDIGVKAFDQSVYAAKKSDELLEFYDWCKHIGVARSSEFPNVQKITDELLGGLETFLIEKENACDMNEIKALPPPESQSPPPAAAAAAASMFPPVPSEDLVNLKDGAHGNKLGLCLFSVPSKVATPDETLESQDPFAASFIVPPPLYVQIADMEKKKQQQNLLTVVNTGYYCGVDQQTRIHLPRPMHVPLQQLLYLSYQSETGKINITFSTSYILLDSRLVFGMMESEKEWNWNRKRKQK